LNQFLTGQGSIHAPGETLYNFPIRVDSGLDTAQTHPASAGIQIGFRAQRRTGIEISHSSIFFNRGGPLPFTSRE